VTTMLQVQITNLQDSIRRFSKDSATFSLVEDSTMTLLDSSLSAFF
jgi:hypothetical protein